MSALLRSNRYLADPEFVEAVAVIAAICARRSVWGVEVTAEELARQLAMYRIDHPKEVPAVAITQDDAACAGCDCLPGEGRTPGCMDPDGCGYR